MHTGEALFDVGRGLMLPDTLECTTSIERKPIRRRIRPGGISYDSDGIRLQASLVSETRLRMYWELCPSQWKPRDAWGLAEAAQAALSFLCGRTVALLERRTRRRQREYIERRRREPVTELRILALHPRARVIGPQCLDKQEFIKLTTFFLGRCTKSSVAGKMCAQMAEAARQRTCAARELLCSTVLEASLRTLSRKPFEPGDRAFRIKDSMDEFRREHFTEGEDWESACNDALEVRNRLRHRNAHPDWLTGDEGDKGDEAFDDTIRLSRFYGYMILAMAGFPGLNPNFPKPHKCWNPIFEMTRPE